MAKAKITSKLLAVLLALVLMLSVAPLNAVATGGSTTANHAGLTVQFGDPLYPSTSPECDMRFTEASTGVFDVSYEGQFSGYYPYILAFYVTSGNSGITNTTATNVTLRDATNTVLDLTIPTDPTDPNYPYSEATAYLRSNGFCTIELAEGTNLTRSLVLTTASGNLTLNFDEPHVYTYPNTSIIPTNFEGYLPVGQFATGSGWGSPYSNGTATSGSTPKLLSTGFASTGLSLGAPGGYAEYDITINNYDGNTKIQRPYGVDFVVYGNAFNGNPEAGSVKVWGYEKDKTAADSKWYELAGSLYYSDVTLRNVTVTYKKVTTTDSTFTTKGIWYRIDDASNNQITGWTKFNQTVKNDVQQDTTVAWWPEETEGYLGVNGVHGAVDDVVVDTNANTIAYQHVTIVKDTDLTTDYTFGYFDVTPNPDSSSSYGVAINPYTTYVSGTKGGDGYDLDWAVDEYGNPVELAAISKVRVYTSAGMKTDGSKLFTIPAIFGETSAELCGIFATSGTASDTMVKATSASFVVSNPLLPAISQTFSFTMPTDSGGTVTGSNNVLSTAASYGATTANVTVSAATGAIVYVNETKLIETGTGTYTGTVNITSFVSGFRVIVQKGDACPYIALID